MIASKKLGLAGHAFRQDLAHALTTATPKIEVDIYGFGGNAIQDKRHALDPYDYTLVVENAFIGNYVTEKIMDAYLGFCQPIYFGAANVQDFFPAKVIQGPTRSVDSAVTSIKETIQNRPCRADIIQNRHAVMFENNLFYLLRNQLERYYSSC